MRSKIVSKLRALIGDRRANVAIMTAFSALPLVGIAGLAIDYASAISTKAKLDMAADAAVVSAITKAKSVIAAGGTTATAIAQGQTQGIKAFNANMGALNFVQNPPAPAVNIVPNGQVLTATVSYTTSSQNQFGKLFNVLSTTVSGSSASSTVVTPYYQFIFVVDISGSMAIGGTPGDVNGLIHDGRIGCAVACHDPYNNRGPDYRAFAKADGWNLKIDYVNQAIQTFISSLKTQTASIPGVFSVGIDTFATYFNVLQVPTTNLITAQASATQIDIEKMQPYLVSQGYTRTTTSLQSALALLNNIGDGSSPSKQATYIIFLSDGIEDIEGGGSYGRGTDITYTSACQTITNAKATLISIEASYPVVYDSNGLIDSQYAEFVAPFAPPHSPTMSTAMKSCASSPSWAFQATDGPGINTAVQTALKQILQGVTRLTQ